MLQILTAFLLGVSFAATDDATAPSPTTKAPEAKSPAAESSQAETPDAEAPDARVPKEATPESEEPEAVSPEAESPTPAPKPEMLEALQIAKDAYAKMASEIQDYTCQLTKRERVNGYLFEHQTMLLKIRHPRMDGDRVQVPLSIYIRFLSPARLKGREVIYVAGKNDDKLIVRNGGSRLPFVTTSVAPDCAAAMKENRYPTTEVGMMNLTARLIEAGEGKLLCPNCDTVIAAGAKINGRQCTLIQVSNVVQRESQTFKTARIFVDDDLQLPVRYSAYDWPREKDGEPVLLEEYTYTDIKLNVGLTDWDFDHRNEDYAFMKSFRP
jgi:hypothetical protein